MLGEQTGRITSICVLPPDGPDMQLEITVQGSGTLLGQQVTVQATYIKILRPDKTFFCRDGQIVFLTAEGDTAYSTGFAAGRSTGKLPASRLAACGYYRTTSAKWLRLNSMVAVSEWVTAEDGSGRLKVWEWKTPEA